MKVVLIYRNKHKGGFSIEELFKTVAKVLKSQIDLLEYEVGSRWKTLVDIWLLRKLNADVYHVTGDINYYVFLLPHKKTVITIHDINHYNYTLRGLKKLIYKWIWLIWPIQIARMVTSVSMETYNSIRQNLGILKHIDVIENCYSSIFKPALKKTIKESPTILQVGTKTYKNVPRLIEAIHGLRCRLILVGYLNSEIKNKLLKYNIDYENYEGLSHEELYQKYIDSDLVSFVSINGEGFGIPIIEAQAVGRPLITSLLAPMCDVAGDGACLVDPFDVSKIREGILKIINNDSYRDLLINNGFKNVARFSPENTSNKYKLIYEKLLSSNC